MVPKYFFALCALVLVLAVLNINAEQESESRYEALDSYVEDDSNEIKDTNPIIKKILKILEKAFKHVAKNCLEGAAKHCKKYWYNPSKLIDCATNYLSDGSCIVGNYNAEQELESQYESLDSYLEDDSNEIEDMNPIIKRILKILEKAFKNVAKNCLEGAAKHCKKYWYNPSKLIDCATDYLFDGSCIVGN